MTDPSVSGILDSERTTWRPTPRAQGVRKAVAAVEGAVEGVAESMERHNLAGAAHRAIDQVDQLAQEVARKRSRPSPMARKLHQAAGRAQAKVHEVQESVTHTVNDARQKARAVAETGRRARQAPGEVTRDLGKAFHSWSAGVVAGLGWMSAMAGAAVFALVLLTMAAVAGLTLVVGSAAALLIVGSLYAIAAIVCLNVAKAARAKARAEARQHVEEAREDLRHVAAPVRAAFGNKDTR